MSEIRRALVWGAGNMGTGIAAHLASHGVEVFVVSRTPERLQAARRTLHTLAQEIGAHQGELAAAAVGRIGLGVPPQGVRPEVIVEAIVERAADKQALFLQMESEYPGVPIWSTTSSLRPSDMTGAMAHPERLVVAHYANPAHLVPVVEVVPGPRTEAQVTRQCITALRAWGKKPVLVQGEPAGFVFNRLQYAVMREAVHLVRSGVISAQDLDTVVTHGWGLRLPTVGPLAMVDLSGLDVYARIARLVLPDLCNETVLPELDQMASEGQTFHAWDGEEAKETLRRRLRQALMRSAACREGESREEPDAR